MTARSGQAVDLPDDSPLRGLGGRPTLVVFLRSFGCTFCREAMADVAAAKLAIRDAGANIAFVHGASSIEAARWFAKYDLDDVMAVSDPDLAHYAAFGLGKASTAALINPRVWSRGAMCALSHGFGMQPAEMLRQLPGVFLMHGDRIVAEFRHRTGADRPDYVALVRGADSAVR
ncbi:MAG TPA: SelL-related redox protein [Vicinamibacterales bacterium]|nr:SelL-related redox protein [Vicinamibacterales bacterium]